MQKSTVIGAAILMIVLGCMMLGYFSGRLLSRTYLRVRFQIASDLDDIDKARISNFLELDPRLEIVLVERWSVRESSIIVYMKDTEGIFSTLYNDKNEEQRRIFSPIHDRYVYAFDHVIEHIRYTAFTADGNNYVRVYHVFISPGGINPISDIFRGLESFDITYILQSLDTDLYEYDIWRPSIKPDNSFNWKW